MTRSYIGLTRLLLPLIPCIFTCCIVLASEPKCDADNVCVAPTQAKSSRFSLSSLVPGVNGVPVGYLRDMAQLLLPNISWLKFFCNGVAVGCTEKYNWPGPQTYSQIGWEKVHELGSQMPRNEWSGKWWRGNELGSLINNPFFYGTPTEDNSTALSPMAIALGIAPKQHAVVRPIFDRAFVVTKDNYDSVKQIVEESATRFLETKKINGQFGQEDLKMWFHQIINKLVFNRDVDDAYAKAFVDTQTAMLGSQLVSQALPKWLYKRDPLKLKATRAKIFEYVNEYKVLLKEQHWDLIEGQDCSPSVSCLDQVAYGMFDALVAAGGVSVPGTIFQALAVLYSKDKSNPAGPEGITYKPSEALQMHWEAVRMFPPVVVFPYWEPRPTCVGLTAEETAALSAPNGETKPCPLGKPDPSTGFPQVNQYQGGMRYLPNVAMAQQDPEKWGADAAKFKLRPLDHYEKYSLGFAEMAVDPNVAGGRMNRNCPGKQMALIMGSAFLKLFHKDQWVTNPATPIKIKLAGPYVADFPIYSKDSIEKCHREVCKCKPGRWIVTNPLCRLCVRRKCPM